MTREHVSNTDGEFLIVARQGQLRFRTEFGVIDQDVVRYVKV